MDNIKIIDLSSNKKQKLSKKQFYSDLLSNTEKVKEIINRKKKTKRFDYLNTIPLKKNLVELNKKKITKEITSNPSSKNKNLNKSTYNSSKIIKPTAKYVSFKETNTNKIEKSTINSPKIKINDKESEPKLKQKGIDNYFKPITTTQNIKKSPSNKQYSRQRKSHNNKQQQRQQRSPNNKQNPHQRKSSNNKQQQRQRRSPHNKQQPRQRKSPNNKQYPRQHQNNNKRLSNPKTFTQEQLVYIIKVMYKLNEIDDILRIHKLIRRLNKIQINQCLFALRLIKKKSSAPIAMLKNSLFNYITANVIIT